MGQAANLDALRTAVARIERGAKLPPTETLPFGIPALDDLLPGGGIPIAALHEVVGTGLDTEFAAAPALFAAGILARRPGPVLWVLERQDLFAPALAAAGLHPSRVIYAEAGRGNALLLMEEGLRHRGLAGVVAEISAKVGLTASRRLHLAAQAGGAIALMLRRPRQRPPPDRGAVEDGAPDGALAAATRWRIGPEPSAPPVERPGTAAASIPGLGRMRWRLELTRCRGGRTGAWIMEACDAAGRLGLVSTLADGSSAAQPDQRSRSVA